MSPRAMRSRTVSTPRSYAARSSDERNRRRPPDGPAQPARRPRPAATAAARGRHRAGGRAGVRRRRAPGRRSTRGPSADPTRRPSRGGRGASVAGPGRLGRSSGAAPASAPGRSRGSRRGPPRKRGASAGTIRVASRRDEPAGDGEQVGPGGRRLEDRDGVGGQVRPSRVASGSRTLEQGQARQVAERLGRVDRTEGGDPLRQATGERRPSRATTARASQDRRGSRRG